MAAATKAPKASKFDPTLGVFVDDKGNPLPARKRDRIPPVSSVGFKIDLRSVFSKDPTLIMGPVVSKDADGFIVGNAGKKALKIKPREVYRKGKHFRVTGVNIRMEAMCRYGDAANGQAIWSGWSRLLPEGTIVECIGWRRFRRNGMVAPQFVYDQLPAEAQWSTVWPKDGIWRPWPLAGILVPVELVDGEWVEVTNG